MTNSETTPKPKIAIFVRIEDAGTSYDGKRMARIAAQVCTYKDSRWNEDFDFATSYGPIAQYEHVKMTELLSSDRPAAETAGEIRAYDIDRAYAYELKATAKTLEAIGRRIEAINAKHGRPTTFGHSVLRLAAAVGANVIITAKSEEARQRTGEK